MLDDDDRVAHVAQPGERVEQPVVVAGMQTDRGLVENVEHADQAATDLPGQADALRFSARQGGGRAAQGQIVEPDVEQKAEPAANLLEHLGGDRLPHVVHSSSLKNLNASVILRAQTSGNDRLAWVAKSG